MNHFRKSALPALLALVVIASEARAERSENEFGLDARIGYLSDSNVNVVQLDSNTGSGDTALDLQVGVDAKLALARRLSLKLGYGYNGVRYETFDEFNLVLNQWRGALDYRVGGFDASVAAEQYSANLDNDRFLDIRQMTPSLGRLFGNRLYLRGAWTTAGKEYQSSPERNASNSALRMDAYLLLDGMNRFLSFGYVSEREDAFDEAFDYDGSRILVGAGNRIGDGTRSLMLRARAQFDVRDYRGVTASIETERADRRFRADVSATLGMTESVSLEGRIGYADNASNLDSARFKEVTYGVSMGMRF